MANRYNITYTKILPWSTILPSCLPRNVRATSKGRFNNPPIVERLVESFTPRTLRLLLNADELEREVLDSSPSHGSLLSVSQEEANGVENELSDEELQRTLQLARSARLNVHRNNMTKEFHEACEEEDWSSYKGWGGFKENCRNHHAWGEYFRSELDWDWDLAGSLKRMYKLPRNRSKPSPGLTQHGEYQFLSSCACPDSVRTPPTCNLTDGLLRVKAAVDGPVKEVQVEVRLPTGEITYQKFIAAPPSASGLNQESADTRPTVKVDGASGLCPSPNPTGIPISTAPSTNDHHHYDYDHIESR